MYTIYKIRELEKCKLLFAMQKYILQQSQRYQILNEGDSPDKVFKLPKEQSNLLQCNKRRVYVQHFRNKFINGIIT